MMNNHRRTWPAFRSCGIRIDAVPLDEVVRMIVARNVGGAVHLCNAYTLSLASTDSRLSEVLERSSLNLPDGMPLIWIARWLGLGYMNERVYGPDVMARVLEQGQASGLRHYLYGSTPEVRTALTSEIRRRWPDAELVGGESPPFRSISDVELHASMDRAAAAGADVVWVGMGTPTQDLLSERMAAIGPAVYVAVGAAFDFIAGTKKQAPVWMQRSGLEWCYRLATEPNRLWKRYLVGNTRFVVRSVRTRPVLVPGGGQRAT